MVKTLFLVCLFISSPIFAQDVSWDVLDSNLLSYTKEDTTRVKLLIDATWYHDIHNFNENVPLIEEALNLSNTLGYKRGRAMSFIAWSKYYYRKGDFSLSTQYALDAIPLLSEKTDRRYIREARSCLAKVERENDNFSKGITIYNEIIDEIITAPATIEKGTYYLNLANIYMNLHTSDSIFFANEILNKAEANFTELESKTGLAMTKIKRARYYKNLAFKDKTKREEHMNLALKLANESLETFNDDNQTANQSYAYYTLATSNSILGNHKESIPFYEKALASYEQIGDLFYAMRINQHLFVSYSILNDQSKAMSANKAFVNYKDSIFSLETRKLIADSQTKFDTAKISADKERAEAESLQNRNYLIGSIVIASLILLSSLFFFGRIKARKQAELVTMELRETQKRLALEKQYRDSELKALKSQMNPHFIFNALNSIQEYIVMNKKNEASDYLGKFADLIRTYLGHSDTGVISLQEEIDSLNMYLDLEGLRFEDKLNYELTLGEKLNKDMIFIPTMLIQPYVENALKHGLLHKKDNRILKVSFSSSENNTIECVVEDNGVGREKAKELQASRNKLHKSFAAKATEERLDLLNYGKDKKIGVTIEDLYDGNSVASGTRVVLNIPIKKG